jgi:hypothetical protein
MMRLASQSGPHMRPMRPHHQPHTLQTPQAVTLITLLPQSQSCMWACTDGVTGFRMLRHTAGRICSKSCVVRWKSCLIMDSKLSYCYAVSLFFTITNPTYIDTQIIFISVHSVVMLCPCCIAIDLAKRSGNIAVSLFYPVGPNHAGTYLCLSHMRKQFGAECFHQRCPTTTSICMSRCRQDCRVAWTTYMYFGNLCKGVFSRLKPSITMQATLLNPSVEPFAWFCSIAPHSTYPVVGQGAKGMCRNEAATSPAESWLPAGLDELQLWPVQPKTCTSRNVGASLLDPTLTAEADFCPILLSNLDPETSFVLFDIIV